MLWKKIRNIQFDLYGGVMKVSQFIKLLQRLEYEHGDIAVINADNYTPNAVFKELDVIGPVIVIR
jgi:hypothetical protein